MTVKDIKDFVASIDPAARHYFMATDGRDFTVWMEYHMLGLEADDDGYAEEGWRFEISRFTKTENDAIADALLDALKDHPRIALRSYDVESDLKTGYVRHIFDCEGA